MPLININRTVNDLVGVSGLTFTANAVQGSNTYPLTATYTAPTLNLSSGTSVGSSGNFTFNVTANFNYLSNNCSKQFSFTENITNLITNVHWYGNLPLPNYNNPFANDDVGWNNPLYGHTAGNILKGATLLPGNDESIFEFYFGGTAGFLQGSMITFSTQASGRNTFGMTHGGHCGYGNVIYQYSSRVIGVEQYTVEVNFPVYHQHIFSSLNCVPNNTTVTFGGPGPCHCTNEQITFGGRDLTYWGQPVPYPKTLFKMRMINGNYELYKNNVLLGTIPYDNTKSYTISLRNFCGAPTVNTIMQIVRIEGNFAPY